MKYRNLSASKILIRRYLALLKNFLLIFAMSLAIFGIGYIVLYTEFFRIKHVTVKGESKFVNLIDVETLVKNSSFGHNIFTIDIASLAQALQNNFQGAKSFTIAKKLPNSLDVRVFERTPMLLLFTKDSTDLFMVDIDGYILGNVLPDYINLPKLQYSGDIKVGYFIDKNLVPVFIDIKTAMDEHRLQMSSLSFSDRYTHMFVSEGNIWRDIELFVGNSKDKKESVQIVSDLLKQFKLEGKSLKKIDLRYDKVIVE